VLNLESYKKPAGTGWVMPGCYRLFGERPAPGPPLLHGWLRAIVMGSQVRIVWSCCPVSGVGRFTREVIGGSGCG